MKTRASKLNLRLFVVAIILTVAAGWILTGYLGNVAEKEFREKINREASLIASFLHDNLGGVENAAKALSQAEQLGAALSSGSLADLVRANKLLDRVNNSLKLSVCYLLDKNGLAVASSNRNERESFVGKNFAFRPYFTGAIAGLPATYFALGTTSNERGYYAAAPIINKSGAIAGIIVTKRNVAPIGEFFSKYTHAFLVSPEGIIFISSNEELLFRSLWPVDEKSRFRLSETRQFGKVTFEPLLAAEPRTGTYIRFENEKHYALRLPFGNDGWTLVFIDAPHIVSSYRLFGILLTIVFVTLLLFFFNVLLYKDNSLHAARSLEQLQKEYAQRLEFVLEGSNDATWEWDILADQGVINKKYYELMGYTPGEEDLNLAFFMTTIHPEDVSEVQMCMREHLEGKTVGYEAHYRMVTKSGKLKDVMMRGKIVRFDEDGRPTKMAGVVTDVTEMKRLGEEVNRINNLESIGFLAGGLAHDFNNVLNVIYGNITFVRMLAGSDPAVIESLSDAEEACERARELGIRLQAFSQGSAPSRELITLPALIEDAAAVLLKGSQISHAISAADDVMKVEADVRQIRQVFENLLGNAKEAMTDDGTIRINIENYRVDGNSVLPIGSGRYVCVTMQDNGRGIPADALSKIFDPYFSTKDTYSQKGMGLGLSICHAILKRHGGHISLESDLGIGTRVTAYLPASELTKEPIS